MRPLSTVLRDVSLLRHCATSFGATLLAVACSHAPPEGFAPDPGLVAQIRDIRIVTTYARACPGAVIPTTYEAVLTDGSRVPFARSYEKKHPPRLHVIFLDRTSPEAVTQQDGDWVTDADPLVSATTGFRLTATLQAKPSVTNTVVVPPDYRCMPHAFVFSGEPGGPGESGDNGPDATVRLAVLRSPFYDQLFVAGAPGGAAPPIYPLQQVGAPPPGDWAPGARAGGPGGPWGCGWEGRQGRPGSHGREQPALPRRGGRGARTGRECRPDGQPRSARPAVHRGHGSHQGNLRAPGAARAGLAVRAAAAEALNDCGLAISDCGLRWSRAFNPTSAIRNVLSDHQV